MRNILVFVFVLCTANLLAQNFTVRSSKVVFKKVDGDDLEMFFYHPEKLENQKLPAIVFFFGGGWVSGTPDHFKQQAEYLASRGIVAICPAYRTKKSHNTSPFECVKDAKSAIRFIKSNGEKFGVDTSRIVHAGGSAGGHLAASTAILDKINEDNEDLSISTRPLALVLFNPVVDTGKRGYGYEKVKGREFEISPVHHIVSGVPPTLIMHGTDDTTVPFENVFRFKEIMKQAGNECKLVSYKNQSHGFFNFSRKPEYFKKTMRQTEDFLEELNLLKGSSWLNKYFDELKEE